MTGQRVAEWGRLGSVRMEALVEARVQVHWAVQSLSAAADAVLEQRDDDSHTNLRWNDRLRALVGHPTKEGRRVALAIADFALLVLGDSDQEERRLSLHGHTLDAALAWVSEAVKTDRTLRLRSYRMPEHGVSRGERFSAEPGVLLDELARWYATADEALLALAGGAPDATPIATWPHHFDMGGIFYLDREAPPEDAPQIGFGMSPGDDICAEPYYYVTPWPLPDGDAALPELPAGGTWRVDGLDGAVLTATAIAAAGGGDARRDAVAGFLRAAVDAGRAMITA